MCRIRDGINDWIGLPRYARNDKRLSVLAHRTFMTWVPRSSRGMTCFSLLFFFLSSSRRRPGSIASQVFVSRCDTIFALCTLNFEKNGAGPRFL